MKPEASGPGPTEAASPPRAATPPATPEDSPPPAVTNATGTLHLTVKGAWADRLRSVGLGASLKLGAVAPADGAATLTAFTAAAIARVVPLLPKRPKSWIICGGGASNLTMLRMLRERLAPATVEPAEALGWAADAIEAQAFGFLAARGMKGLPLSYPTTTGVPIPMTGGIIARP